MAYETELVLDFKTDSFKSFDTLLNKHNML